MFDWLRRASIRFQVLVPIVLVTNGGFLAASGAFIWLQERAGRDALVSETTALAHVTAANCLTALTFGDRPAAGRTLASLATHPDVRHAVLYRPDGTEFARFDAENPVAIDGPRTDGLHFNGNSLTVVTPTVNDGTRVGTLALETSMARVAALRRGGLLLALVLFGLSIPTIGLLAWWVHRRVSKPIVRLAQAATAISRDQDYSRRVQSRAENEVGILFRSFNDMLSQIQARDDELQQHRSHLEQEVDARTVELREALVTAEGLARAKAEFLATMSHEIRTPMNGVVGVAEMLLQTSLTSEQRELAEMIAHSGENLLVIINDILDFSRVDAGRLSLEHIPFDLVNVVEESAELLAPKAHAKDLELIVSLRDHGGGQVIGDPTRLRQILTNLIGNAIKFTERGGITLTLATSRNGDRMAVRLEVEDTGIGICPDAQARIFEPFTQADGSTTRRFGGTGLGLAIVKRLSVAMGGDIGLESAIGRGSRFRVDLPFEPAVALVAPVEPRFAGWAALVVDEHGGSASELRTRLEALGVDVAVVTSASDGLDRLEAARGDGRRRMVFVDGDAAFSCPSATTELAAAVPAGAAVLLEQPGTAAPLHPTLARVFSATLRKPVRRAALLRLCESIATPRQAGVETHAESPVLAPFAGARVLVAEDNPINQRVVLAMLKRLGCETTLAPNGCEAVERCREQEFDVVLMDCQMPEMDGFEATRTIRHDDAARARARRVPIIALTANALCGDREACLAAGMDDYLSKPISPTALANALTRWAHARATGTEAAAEAS